MVIKGRTLRLIKAVYRILQNSRPMTQGQIYTQLIKRGDPSNTLDGNKILADALVKARQEGLIPWAWIKEEEEDLIKAKEGLIREKKDED